MDHDIRCIFDDIDPNDNDALSLFLNDLEDEPVTGDAAPEVDDIHSLLNDDNDKSETFLSQAGGAFRSPQPPPPAATPNVPQPGNRTTPIQQNMVTSPRTSQQPTTPGSVADSPYSQHHPATPSPASRQLTTPSPMDSPVPNSFQQTQKQHEVKLPSSNGVPLQNSMSKSQVQASNVIPDHQVQMLNQQHLLKSQQIASSLSQPVTHTIASLQTSAAGAPVQIQLQGTAANGQNLQRMQAQQVQGTVIHTSLGNQVIFQGGLSGQVQLHPQVGINQPSQLVTSQGSIIQTTQPVTIAASNIQPPALQAPPNISIVNLQNQVQPQQQQILLQRGAGSSNPHNVILTTLPPSSMMQLAPATTTTQQNAIPTGMMLSQGQAQVLLTKGGQKVQGQVLLQSQPVSNSQLQMAGLKPAAVAPNTLTVQNQQGQIINIQQPAQQGTIVQNVGPRVEVNQVGTTMQNVGQQRHLLQINGQTLALTTQQLQQLINLQQKKQLVQQASVPQHQQEPRLQQDQSQVHLLQHPGTGLQVITTSGSSSSGIIAKSVSSTNSQPTLATQAAVQQNLQEIHDKMLKQSSQQQMVINDLNAVSRNNAVGSLQNIPGVAATSSQALGNTATPVAALTQAGTLTVLGAAGQPQANRVNVVGQGQLLTQAVVQHPPQAGVIQLQPTPGQAAVVSKSGLVAVQAIAVQNVNQQQMAQNKQQVTQFRQILPSTSQVMSTVMCTQPVTTLTNSVSNFTNLLPSATSKPSVVAPNVNIQTLGLGNQVNSLVLQQQLQQQQKERQLQQQQQKASLRLLPGQPPSSTNLVPGQINASLALQQLNVAQQQRNSAIPQDGTVTPEQQQVNANDLPQAVNGGVASQKVAVTSAAFSGHPLGSAACTLSTQGTQVTSPLISTVTMKAQGTSSTIEVKSVGTQQGIGSNLLNTSASSGGIVRVAHSTPVLLSTAPAVPNINSKSQSGPTISIQKPVMNNVTLTSAPSGQGQPGVSRVPTIQLTPQLQQALATVHQKTRALLAIPNRTEAQNASLQQLMVWQQKILLIGRTQALKAQQSQQVSGVSQAAVPAAGLQSSVHQTSQQPQLIIQKPSGVSQQVTTVSSAAAIPVQVQELLTSAASAGTNLVTTFATTTVVSQSAHNISTGDGRSKSGVTSHETKVITNINQLPPEMKEKLRLQLAKLTPAQLDYFLKNQAYVLTRLIKQQQEMQKLRQEQTQHPNTTPNVVKVAADQKQILQQIGSGGITIVAASDAPVASAVPGSTVTAAVTTVGHTPTSTTGVVTVKVPVKMSRKQLFSHYIAKDQKNVEQPDYKQPFQNHKDILKRLLAYHVCQVKEDKRKHIEEGAAAYEETAQELLVKKDEMFKKYQHLILEESIRQDRTAEMVMLERMFLASEKEVLAEEKKQAEQDPEHFVPAPCLSSDEEDSSEECQVSNSLVPSPVTPPPADVSIDSMNTSNLKHSNDCMTDEQTSPGGNYTLRASTGLRLVFKTSPLHTNVSSPAPLTENFSVKSEDSGISSQQNSVETDEDGVPPKKKICVSVSEDKEHYRTSNCIKPNVSGKVSENGMPKEEPNVAFDTYKDELGKRDTSGEVSVSDQDNRQKQLGIAGQESVGANEADAAVAGLLSSSNMLSQDLGVCSDDLFSELTLEQHLNQGLPSDFMAESAKEDKSELHQEYYSEISDYDTDTNAGGKEQEMELQDAIGGLLSDMETEQESDVNKLPFFSQSSEFGSKGTVQMDSSDKLDGENGKFGGDNMEPDDVKCTDETRSAIDSLLALESPSSFNYL